MLKDKLRAFFFHFLTSLSVLAIAGIIIFRIWYPEPFSQLFDVKKVFLMMLGIDLILGPLLTFVVYKKGKKTLKTDLATIVLVQLAAFSWGMWSIAEARPAWLVLYKDALFAVSPSVLKDSNGKKMNLPIVEQNWFKPKLMMIKDTQTILKNQIDVPVYYQYRLFSDYDPKIANKAILPLSKIKSYDEKFYQTQIAHKKNVIGYFPILTDASTKVSIALMNANGQIENILLDEKMEK